MKKVLIFDGQVFQTAARDRGMGKYSFNLIEAIVGCHADDYQFLIIFNSNLAAPEELNDNHFKELPSDLSSVYLNLPTMSSYQQYKNEAKDVLTKYIHKYYAGKDVTYMILSLFTFDYCAAFPDGVNKSLIFYDLIPLKYWESFKHLFIKNEYFERFNVIFEADKIFAISQESKEDLENILGISSEKVINIRGACIAREPSDIGNVYKKYGRYVIFPSADMTHKNNINAVTGFAAFNETFGNQFKLIITSSFSENSKQELRKISENLIFTDAIPDDEYNSLLNGSECLLFASRSEGLGLPVLEAVAADKPIACSDIPSITEMSETSFYIFDPNDPNDIKSALINCVAKDSFKTKIKDYATIKETYTWGNSSKLVMDNISNSLEQQDSKKAKLKVYFPWTDDHKDALDICLLIMLLSREFSITVEYNSSNGDAPTYTEYVKLTQKTSGETKVLYILTNNEKNYEILQSAILKPAIVVLMGMDISMPLKGLVDHDLMDVEFLNINKKSRKIEDIIFGLQQNTIIAPPNKYTHTLTKKQSKDIIELSRTISKELK